MLAEEARYSCSYTRCLGYPSVLVCRVRCGGELYQRLRRNPKQWLLTTIHVYSTGVPQMSQRRITVFRAYEKPAPILHTWHVIKFCIWYNGWLNYSLGKLCRLTNACFTNDTLIVIRRPTGCLIEIDVYSFQLQVWCSTKSSLWINTMFVCDYFPKLHHTRHRQAYEVIAPRRSYLTDYAIFLSSE